MAGRWTGAVREGSITDHTCWRADRGPHPPPPGTGEWAKVATSTGPTAWARRHRVVTSAGGPVSTLTWTDAVEHIMVRPAKPSTSKKASMAA